MILRIIFGYMVVVFLISCSSSSNKENFKLGSLEIIDHGPALPSSEEFHYIVDPSGKITSTEYLVQNGTITQATWTWDYQMSAADKNLVEQEATDADILYRGDVTLPQGATPCTGAGDLVFNAISKSGLVHQFTVSGEARCYPFDDIPTAINKLYSFITGWSPNSAQ